jgi:HD-like signal output (HDOD) protein
MGAGKQEKELDLDQQIEFLKKIHFFSGFDDHELRQFLQVSRWKRVAPDAMIIRENTTERAFYILVKGEVRVEKQLPGVARPIVLTTLATGDCFGEMALVAEVKRTANVVASRESFLLRVEPEIVNTSNVFLQLKFYKRFCESLVARLDSTNKRVVGRADQESSPPGAVKPPVSSAAPLPKAPPPKGGRGKTPAVLPPMPDKELRLSASKLHARLRPENILPVNPAVADELDRLLAVDAGTDTTRHLADLVSLDPVLSCRVIQVANSPFFRRATMVGTVPHAMVIVGVKQIQEVVTNTMEPARRARAFSGFVPVARDFWKHAVLVGRIAEMLRDVIGLNISADLFLCGLTHDLGMLVLDGICPDFYPQLMGPLRETKDLAKEEKEYIGADHGQAGAWFAESLGLPQACVDVMKFHHAPEKATAHHLQVALVSLANLFASLKGACVSRPGLTEQDVLRSFAWVLIQEQHKPFLEVNIAQFIASFSLELDRTWDSLTADILL